MQPKKTPAQKQIAEEALLKSLGLLENDLQKGFKAADDDSSEDETETADDESSSDESETPMAKGSKKESKGTAGMPKKLKEANGALSTQGSTEELSKSFSDNASEETREVLDTTPFFIDLRDFLDQQAGGLNGLQKSVSEIHARSERDDKILKSLAGAVIEMGREISRQGSFLNDFAARLNMPVTKAPRSILAKSEVAEREFGDEVDEKPQRDPNAISKAEFNNALDQLVIEGKIDHRAVIAYETSGERVLPEQVRNVVAHKALAMRAATTH